ncbi:hypothetical protein H6F75_00585 [Nodosilinea sp. FACHB-131]|uniref:hypothetical protein n=1 Tax=Cyanophyceae TaxID=3028117 RepID=UPI001681DBCE|nr:hypothetical protein [Nodosilinea sp. FACHB-131]MBD1871967.1 hypothetical protein [Nodosilinea sp. FACHB-131]
MAVVVARLIPGVTIVGGGSSFALDGQVTPAETSATFTQAAFTVYGAAFLSPSSTPTGAAVEAGTGAVAVTSGSAIASIGFTGLSAGTTYDFYFAGKNAAGQYTAVTKITATTSGSSGVPGIIPVDSAALLIQSDAITFVSGAATFLADIAGSQSVANDVVFASRTSLDIGSAIAIAASDAINFAPSFVAFGVNSATGSALSDDPFLGSGVLGFLPDSAAASAQSSDPFFTSGGVALQVDSAESITSSIDPAFVPGAIDFVANSALASTSADDIVLATVGDGNVWVAPVMVATQTL